MPLHLRFSFVNGLRSMRGAAVTLRVIQYGATRQTLKRALREGAGWDVIHISAHGLEGKLALEDDAARKRAEGQARHHSQRRYREIAQANPQATEVTDTWGMSFWGRQPKGG